MKRKILKNVIKYIIIIISLLIIFLSIYINKYFNNISFEQLIYSVIYNQGTSFSAIFRGIIFVVVGICISLILIGVFIKYIRSIKTKIYFNVFYKNKKITFDILRITKLKSCISIILLFMISIFSALKLLNIDEYLNDQFNSTKIFEDYYVVSQEVNVNFPDEKQNLIYIFVESLEMTNASIANGGALEESYIPNLEQLALYNINFSNTDKLGGALSINATTFTAAAMISQTSGVPLKVSIDSNMYKGYSESLPGVYSIGEILKDNGYKNYLMLGSDASFGGRKDYFESHGNYTIYDYNYAKEEELIEEDYYVWWGYEDKKLYEFAKDRLEEISESDEPFNFTLLTADTHFVDGYQDETCEKKFSNKYANSFYCADSMLIEFINWIQEQDFYEDTTIVIVGDHLTMQEGFYDGISTEYQRNIYNTIINAKQEPINEKNRLFSSFDLYPTTLAALGVEIDGDRLGLGTNLFSDKQTLIERLGYNYFNEEMKKKSFYYDNYILGNTYYEMQKESN